MKLGKLGLLGIIASASLSTVSHAQIFARPMFRTQERVEENIPQSETQPLQLRDEIPESSTALAPLNPYLSTDSNRLIHLEYFTYVPEKHEEEDELKYLEFLRKERKDRKKIEYINPIEKIESWMKVGISLYSTDWKGYPYNISIKEDDVEFCSYDGVVEDVGKIPGLKDLGVI